MPKSLSCILLCLLATASYYARSTELDTAAEPAAVATQEQEGAYREALSLVESTEGAYGAGLPELLLGLGRSLQAQGRHQEALQVLSRGMHLARINDGLYSKEQIPLLQAQIASYEAVRDYARADERQHYLYRVQVRSLDQGEELIAALMAQAQWQYNAYRLSRNSQNHARLMNMWDLYRMALNSTVEQDGGVTPNTLPPLRGLLRTQYLISGYRPAQSFQNPPEDMRERQKLYRFNNYHSQIYDRGNSVISTIVDVEKTQTAEGVAPPAQTMLMLGDWQLWHGKTDSAIQSYLDAATELAPDSDAKQSMDKLLQQPVPLPDIDGLRPLPPAIDPDSGGVKLEFAVDERGHVDDVDRLDDNEELDSQARRLIKILRRTKFRPRFESGRPVLTQNIVRTFKVE